MSPLPTGREVSRHEHRMPGSVFVTRGVSRPAPMRNYQLRPFVAERLAAALARIRIMKAGGA